MLDADLKANQQINFTGNLVKETVLHFSQGTLKVLQIRSLNII